MLKYRRCLFFNIFMIAASLIASSPVFAASTQVTLIGEIQSFTVLNKADVWSKGVISVSGINVIIPRNLIIQMPVSRYTLQELFTQAPESCRAAGKTGLARSDSCFSGYRGAIATILANRQGTGEVIAGEVRIEKAPESLMGVVTYINYSEGYFRLNGTPNDSMTGAMVRLNDPIARHTIQAGLGCSTVATAGSNCSPDIRFGVDNDNYTAAFATGVPLCLPSSQIVGKRTLGANPINGAGDPLCPLANRTQDPVINPIPDATASFFVPLVLGDSMLALGSFEVVNGVKFFSAHTLQVHTRIMTKPGNPDYMTFSESAWDVAGFANQRARLLVIGFTSLTDSQLDIYGLHIDPSNNQTHEVILASTVGNPLTVNRGLPPFGGSIFKINYDVDFVVGPTVKGSPCINLAYAGFLPGDGGCSGGATVDIANNFAVLSPISREIIGRTRNKSINNIGDSTDISGNSAPNGQYQAPVGVSHAEPIEFNLGGLQTPLIFTGEPWLLDRRLSPDGCKGQCESTPQPLDPWPWDGGLDPRTRNPVAVGVPSSVANRILSYVTIAADGTFGFNGALLSLPKVQSPVVPLQPTPVAPMKQCK
ncbi:MAG: hypothetical protein NTY08_18850 [Proteobacteria bacterium]|nr:hypothetical protein [Pseudomonadota bacterium]